MKCPEIELNQLDSITDVTGAGPGRDRRAQAGRGVQRKRKAVRSRASRRSAPPATTGCAARWSTLYHGGLYTLYKYKRFQDVRLVFAPEFAIAFFGGDPDNFNFPRYDLDVSFMRVYEDGKPAQDGALLQLVAARA